jgi:TM2 domain-containing membrane protein YozV
MSIPRSVKTALQSLPEDAQRDFKRDYNKRAKSTLIAYIAWFLLGWHYLYLGRIGMQFAFWFTLGFLFVGWIIDFFRIPGMVGRLNEDLAREIMSEYKMMHQTNAAPVVHTIIQQAPAAAQLQHQPPTLPPSPPPKRAEAKYFCFVSEQVHGPYPFGDLMAMRSQNQIDDDTQCCLEGSDAWVSFKDIKS